MSELQELRGENLRLSDEVKRLVKTERELYEAQERLDGQIRAYRQLYEIGKKFNATLDPATILQLAAEFVLYELNFERCLVLMRQGEPTDFRVEAMDGYYDDAEESGIARVVLGPGSSALAPLYAGVERLLCGPDCDDGGLCSLRGMVGMNEYVVLPLGGEPKNPIGLLIAGNTAERAPYQRRAAQDSEAMLGLANLASQTTTAITNARSYEALERERQSLEEKVRERTHDLEESLEYQTATSDVLQVISRSTFDVQPVLDTLAETAARLCDAGYTAIYRRDGEAYRMAAVVAFSPETMEAALKFQAFLEQHPLVPGRGSIVGRVALEGRAVHVADTASDPDYIVGAARTLGNMRTVLGVPLLREGEPVGVIILARHRVQPFTDRQIELVRTFADQAVIAIENARLITETREALAQQTATAEVLQVINSSPGDLAPVFDAMLARATRLCGASYGHLWTYDGEFLHPFVSRGEAHIAEWFRSRGPRRPTPHEPLGRVLAGEEYVQVIDALMDEGYKVVPDVYEQLKDNNIRTILLIPLRQEDVPLGLFIMYRQEVRAFSEKEIALLQSFAAQAVIAMQNARLLTETQKARDQAEGALRDLKAAQSSLIQAQKMAALGQLTAGIAHEIKNPLNFVNNFAGLSVELLDELKEATASVVASLDDDKRADVDETIGMLTGNLAKIAEHGQRADNIVKSMLEHSRGVSGDRRAVDLNNLIDEALNLAYHGARAQDQNFNIALERHYTPLLKPIEVAPQELTRVFLNLIGNGFYAATKRARESGIRSFQPALTVATRDLGEVIEVKVRDNGTGIAPEIRDKLFQPFFTTKPTGEGTGLGLSISYDIVTQQHGGTIEVDSRVGEFTEFTVRLPRADRAITAATP